ncbi:SMI1/KNR4 family protein [Chelatococcus reniformis]|uniref:Knr4/Smi1-like domain-containing protein n=1 Tax=Chelatococcus reniformis TaxID=1494448 RepID=A0A916UUB0_9HYPH|nr:SMI1/KNR4 family protein [Chelatococcus reniformis]GGC88842.1 hypothetical protein GCM10010994_53420 [Chelatococcus reniformis]
MAFADIETVMPPPTAAIEAAPADWLRVETELGTALPSDYKAYIEAYGSGRIADFIWIFNPFTKRENINLLTQVPRQINVLRELADGGAPQPFPLFPAPAGLLPVGMTDNGDVILWLTVGSPDEWTVVINDSRSPEYAAHRRDLTGFLAGVLTGQEPCPIFPDSFPHSAVAFAPR